MYIEPTLYPHLATPEGVRLLCRYLDALTQYDMAHARYGRGHSTYPDFTGYALGLRDARTDLNHHLSRLRREAAQGPAVERPELPQEGRSEEETALGMGGEGVGALGGGEGVVRL